MVANTKQAMRNLGLDREAASEAKQKKIQDDSHLASQGSQLSDEIAEQVKLVGWKAVGTLEAEQEQLQNSDLRRWNATSQCKEPETRKDGEFCAKVAAAKAKVKAAQTRDAKQTEKNNLPKPTGVVATVGADGQKNEVVANPYVANVAELVSAAGYKPNERFIKAEEILYRSVIFELVAAFGPTAWLAFIDWLRGVGEAAAGIVRKVKNVTKGRKPTPSVEEVQAKVAVPGNAADDVDRFIVAELEVGVAMTERMYSKGIRPIWEAWCEPRGIDAKAREAELWQRLKSMPGVKHDPNNQRPRYLGLKVRAKGPPKLAVVAGVAAARGALGNMGSSAPT